jgi:pSer/pThr/pTyr-binding forkhead associated (FHA) protein
MACLVQFDERGGVVERWDLAEQTLVAGRGGECDIKLADLRASRRHFGVTFQDGAHFLADLGSTNGTLLNGKRVAARMRLSPGDQVRVGQTTLVFQTHKPKGMVTIMAELEDESQQSGKGYRTMLREISRKAKD